MARRWLAARSGLGPFHRDLVAGLLGALSAAALPPLHAVPILLLTVPGLLAMLRRATHVRGAFRIGFWFGFGHHIFGLYWITEAILVEAQDFWWFVPLAVPATATVLALFIALPCGLAWYARPGWRRLWVLAGAWVLADIAREYVGSGFPWNLWGSVWELPGAWGDVMIQPAAWISVHGLTLATMLLAGAPTLTWRGWSFAAIGLAGWIGLGTWRLSTPAPADQGISVILVQGNVPEGEIQDRQTAVSRFERHLALTARAVSAAPLPHIVVWPETASPFLLQSDPAARAAIAQAASGPSLIGAIRFAIDPARPGEDSPRNSLFALDASGAIAGVVDKFHLVPFGEYQPAWLPGLQIVPGGGFHPGPGPRTLHIQGVPPVGVLICYEAIFPGQVVNAADRPTWLVNVTNDAWFGNSSGPRQHLAAARMRAVEEGLPLLRAANTGLTAGFDAFGREFARLKFATQGYLNLSLPGALGPTVFSRYGLIIPIFISLCVCCLPWLMQTRDLRAVSRRQRNERASYL
jgi:apolipoprotein N-acyltransferase